MCAPAARETRNCEGLHDTRGPCACPRSSGYCGNDGECVRMHIRRRFWLATLLHRGVLRGPTHRRRCRCCFEGRDFSLKMVPDIGRL